MYRTPDLAIRARYDAYRRLKQKNNKVFREVGEALRDLFEPEAEALTA